MTGPDVEYRPIKVWNGERWVYVGDPRTSTIAERLDEITGGGDGPPGADGTGVDDVTFDAAGALTVHLSDGTTRGPFPARGADGAPGLDGARGDKGDKGDPTLITTQSGLAAALAAGGDVFVDSNVTIALTATQNITRPTRLLGGRFTRTTGEAFRITSSNVEIAGVTITGGGQGTTYDQTQKLIRAVGTSSNRLTGLNIHDCLLLQSRADNIWLEWTDGARVSGNTIRHFLYSGIEIISGRGTRVTDNDVSDALLIAGVSQVYGIAFSDIDNTAAARSVDCVATGNRVHLIDWEGIDTHGGHSIVVTGNIVTACVRGIALISGNATRLMSPERCVVTGNRINGTGMRRAAREGIILAGISGKPADAVISGNSIENNGTPIFADLWDRDRTLIGNNSPAHVDWSPITMDGVFTANAVATPQYRVDGKVVHLRGAVIPPTTSRANSLRIGRIPVAAAWPTTTSFAGYMKGSNSSAGHGMVIVDAGGVIWLAYGSGTDQFNYYLNGSYVAA